MRTTLLLKGSSKSLLKEEGKALLSFFEANLLAVLERHPCQSIVFAANVVGIDFCGGIVYTSHL